MSYRRVPQTQAASAQYLLEERQDGKETGCLAALVLALMFSVFIFIIMDPTVTSTVDLPPIIIINLNPDTDSTGSGVEPTLTPDPKCSISEAQIGSAVCETPLTSAIQDDALVYPNSTVSLGECVLAYNDRDSTQYLHFNNQFNVHREATVYFANSTEVAAFTNSTNTVIGLLATDSAVAYNTRAYFLDNTVLYQINNQPRLCESYYQFALRRETCNCTSLRTSDFNTTCAC